MLGLALVSVAVAAAADGPPLAFKFNNVNIPGSIVTVVGGVNNAGVMVGLYYDRNQKAHGFILNRKKLTKVDLGVNTGAAGVNPNGAIAVVGPYYPADQLPEEGFLYKNGKFTEISGPAGATTAWASGINDSGEIVGFYADRDGTPHGFLLKGKTYTTLDVPSAVATFATGINNKGDIVLYWDSDFNDAHSSLYDGKTYTTIDVPGAANSYAWGINAEGDVSFSWIDSSWLVHGALLHAGKYYKFNYPGAYETVVTGVNDHRISAAVSVACSITGIWLL
jgi:probable HAF family extracellular repeat protein